MHPAPGGVALKSDGTDDGTVYAGHPPASNLLTTSKECMVQSNQMKVILHSFQINSAVLHGLMCCSRTVISRIGGLSWCQNDGTMHAGRKCTLSRC